MPWGDMDGALQLNAAIAPQVHGPARPFAPGEAIRNPDGSWSSEITVTVTNPVLNGGRPTVIPSLWLLNGRPVHVSEDTAARYAAESGLKFQAFDTIDAAEKFATQREAAWQNLDTKGAARIAPLWQEAVRPSAWGDHLQGVR